MDRSLLAGMRDWFDRHERFLTIATALLFALQLVHLYWLTTHVVIARLTGVSIFNPSPVFQTILIAVDYTEIPALLSTSALYLYQLSKHFSWKVVWYLVFLNTQWLHLFWITDEFVIGQFSGASVVLPMWLAWVAIFIDYLELPVILDTVRNASRHLRNALKA